MTQENKKKNKQGRKSGEYEQLKSAVVNKCWDILDDYLKRNPTLKSKYTKQIVLEIAKKTVPKEQGNTINLFVKNLEADIKQLAEPQKLNTPKSIVFKNKDYEVINNKDKSDKSDLNYN